MMLRQFLATKANDIPLGPPTFSTEHQRRGETIIHVGWKITASYTGEDAKKAKHRYELVFSPEEARLFRERLDMALQRFENGEAEQAFQNG
jgi:hypothetical protein